MFRDYGAHNNIQPIDSAFITEWDLPAGSFAFPINANDSYACTVDWGDGSIQEVSTNSQTEWTHSYVASGTYQIKITGVFSHIYINRSATVAPLIKAVINWGHVGFLFFYRAFDGAVNLTSIPDGPITGAEEVIDFYLAFFKTGFTTIPVDMFSLAPGMVNAGNLFNQGSLTSIPPGLFDNNPLIDSFWYTFAVCPITSIPEGLFDTQISTGLVYSFYRTFYNCSSINTTIYDVWNDYTYLSASNTNDCFYGCVNAPNYANIPISWR